MGWGGRLGAGAGEGQGPAHQSEAASVLHTLVRLGAVLTGERGVGREGCPSPPPSARQSQLTLMNSEQDGTGWKEARVL